MFGEFPGFTVKIIEDGDSLFEKFQLEKLEELKLYKSALHSVILQRDLGTSPTTLSGRCSYIFADFNEKTYKMECTFCKGSA